MKYSLALLATASVVFASPLNNKRQAVTAAISPSAPAPSGCMPSYSGTFGIAVMNLTSSAAGGSPAVTTLPDGQPGASTGVAPPVSTIADGQPQASTGVVPVSTISDGQPQATTGVAPVSTIADGQPQAPTSVAAVSTIADGQPQAPTMTVAPVSQISDGQIQATTMTMAPINQIGDGQIQNQMSVAPVSQISDGQIQATTAAPVSQISDGQIQATTAPVSQISDGQIQATTQGSTVPVSTIADGQPQATNSASSGTKAATGMSYVACKSDSTLEVTLAGGILMDNKGRTGYIASNYQFQFDGPPQAGAIYTAGWTVCGNNSLALGGSAVFYQCLSGNFYNLYDRSWAAQCSPITIQTVALQDC